jgi:hypothetical protein
MTSRRDLIKFASALGIAGMLPATTASATPHADPIEETFTGVFTDLSIAPNPALGYPVYRVWESTAGMTVERIGNGGMIVGVGHGATLRAAIANVVEVVPQELTRGTVRVLHQER